VKKLHFQDITMAPFGGGLDLRNQSGSVPPGGFRIVLNMDGSRSESYCRLNGWKRYGYDPTCDNNLDLHDQMLDGSGFYSTAYDYTTPGRTTLLGQVYSQWDTGYGYGYGTLLDVTTVTAAETTEYCYPGTYQLGGQCHESPTLIGSVTSTTGKRRLVAATKSRIYGGDDKGGNWTILADGLGGPTTTDDCTCSPKRFRMAQFGNTILFTNGIDPVMAWEMGAAPSGCYHWTADFITELQGVGISSAKVVQAWSGFAFVGNVLDSGAFRPYRIYWSDYNDPYAWVPTTESLAGYHDFSLGEKVLAMHPIGGRMLVYTDAAIYEVVKSDNASLVFAVNEMYRGPAVPKYPHSIVNSGTFHMWFGEDDIWVLGDYDRSPMRPEWLRGAAAAVFRGVSSEYLADLPAGILDSYSHINKSGCDNVCGWWNAIDNSAWFSWPTGSSTCPNLSMVIWHSTQKATLIDHGITAAAVHRPDNAPRLRDYFGEIGLCDPETLRADKEGNPCPVDFVSKNPPYTGLVNSTENLSLGVQPGSVLSNFCNMSIGDLCRVCESGERWLIVSAEDKAIKDFTTDTYSREQIVSSTDGVFPAAGVATYTQTSYPSMLQTDALNFRSQMEKLLQAVTVEMVSEAQTVPGQFNCAVGTGSQPACLSWETADPVSMECLDQSSESGTRPTLPPRFAFYSQGGHLAIRLWVDGTGSAFCINGLTIKISGATKCW